ncbi:MAG: glycosyltransferase family 2 protein [Planctomycetaceae bacterium]
MPFVSILVTVYNREAYLEATLRSVLASSFTDFEVIVVDDCSDDQSVEIARNVQREDSRLRVHVNENNVGDYGNRMKAASLANGKYLKYVDSDDLIYAHSLGVMVAAMEDNPTVALALSHSLPEDEQPYPWVLSPQEAYRKQFLGRGCLSCGPSGAIIRREAFEHLGGFRPEWKVLSDIDLWQRLASRWPVALLPPGLVWWRRHEGQEFSSANAELFYLERGFKLVMKTLDDISCPLSERDRQLADQRARHRYARRLISLVLKEGRFFNAWDLYRSSGLKLSELLRGFREP